MIGQRHLDVLRKLVARLQDAQVDGGAPLVWAVTGSLSFALQGVPIEPHDIDLQTDEAGAYAIERCCAADVIRPVRFSTAARIRSHFGALRIDGIAVEIMGDIEKRLPDGSWEGPVDVQQYRHYVPVEGLRVPVLSLHYECEAYRKLGRLEKAALLEQWLAAQPSDEG